MKKILLAALLLLMILPGAFAREYSYLNPPSISIMDFDVNMPGIRYEDDFGEFNDKEFYGRLINQTLLTVLIQKNSSNDFVVLRDDMGGLLANPLEFTEARYFPTLLKIYDKKYVEAALGNNNYTPADLYSKNADAFSYADLDFVVLGNVYQAAEKISVNVRVLNTSRGEELFSYIGTIEQDLSNINEVCDQIAGNIITDILKNYCSQFIIKVKENIDADKEPLYFCQSRQEYDNEDNTINYNDTFKKDVYRETYYWILPGDYVFTVYSGVKKSVHEIPVAINPREIKVIEINETHFEIDTGELVISGVAPTDAYSVEIKEKVKDAEYLWEIEKGGLTTQAPINFTFKNGDFVPDRDDDDKDDEKKKETGDAYWVYNSFANEIVVTNLKLSQYEIILTPVAESVKRKGITGIVFISSREIERSDPVSVDLERDREVTVDIEDFNIVRGGEVDAYQQTRITFLFDPAFVDENTHLFVESFGSTGYLLINEIEKLVIEDEYDQEQWEDLAGRSFYVWMTRDDDDTFYDAFISYESIVAENDRILFTEFRKRPRTAVLSSSSAPSAPSSRSAEASGGGEEEPRGIVAFFQNLFGGRNKD